ncbi:MAG: hypothetical protein ACYC3S_13995 [Chloroflexota bacterium]
MSAIEHDLRTLRAVAEFFAMLYLTFVCQYIAPTAHLRHWGARNWWLLFRLGPGWPQFPAARGEAEIDIFAMARSKAARWR